MGYILSDLKLMESLMTYTLIPKKYTIPVKEMVRKKKKSGTQPDASGWHWTGDLLTLGEDMRSWKMNIL